MDETWFFSIFPSLSSLGKALGSILQEIAFDDVDLDNLKCCPCSNFSLVRIGRFVKAIRNNHNVTDFL